MPLELISMPISNAIYTAAGRGGLIKNPGIPFDKRHLYSMVASFQSMEGETMQHTKTVIVESTNAGLKAMRLELRKFGIGRRASGQMVCDTFTAIWRNVAGEKRIAFLPISEYAEVIQLGGASILFKFN